MCQSPEYPELDDLSYDKNQRKHDGEIRENKSSVEKNPKSGQSKSWNRAIKANVNGEAI